MSAWAYTEHEHGADLSTVETRAERSGDEIFVTGVKTFVAHADTAENVVVLCAFDGQPTYLKVPLTDNNVEIHPILDLAGDTSLFEVVFDHSRAENQVCDPRPGRELADDGEFWDLVDLARQRGRARDPLVRQHLAWAYAQMRIINHVAEPLRNLLWSEYHRGLGELAIDLLGSDGMLRPEGEAYATNRWQHLFLTSRGDTIAARTSEVQRTRIAEQLLGLPT